MKIRVGHFKESLMHVINKHMIWAYLSFILFTSYVNMRMSGSSSAEEYFFWNLATIIAFITVIPYFFISKYLLAWQRWVAFFLLAVLLPGIIIFYSQSLFFFDGLHRLLNENLYDQFYIIYFLNIPAFLLIFLTISLRKRTKRLWWDRAWLRKLSAGKIALVIFTLMALAIPIISNPFQLFTRSADSFQIVSVYIACVLQGFLVYGSYYIYFYVNRHYLFPRVYVNLGIIPYILSLMLMILLCSPILTFIYSTLPAVVKYSLHPISVVPEIFSEVHYFIPMIITVISFPITLFLEWQNKEIANVQLHEQKTQAELALLKQQINPHFFFNTLNNLYALSLEKSEKTPEVILKLSKLMRFVIYKGKKSLVPIKEEIEYIKDYIDLQKIRFKKKIDIHFQVDIDNEDILVPPLLLINIVENAFKHGLEPNEKDGFLHISLVLRKGIFEFHCENSFDSSIPTTGQGIGLVNLHRRLEISYPEEYVLENESRNDKYRTFLKINLSS